VFGAAQTLVYLAHFLAVFVAQLVALVDAASRPKNAYTAEGKLTKTKWLLILGVCAALGFIALPPLGASVGFLNILAVAPAVIYLVDVRPRLKPYGRGSGGSGGSGGSRGGRPGGW